MTDEKRSTRKDKDRDFSWGEVEKNWKLHLILGLFFVATGTIGLVVTPLATLSSVLLFAAFMLTGGIFQLAEAIKATDGWKSRLLHIAGGLLYIAGGAVTIWNPVAASLALTLILAASILVTGILRVIISFQHRHEMRDWIVLLISGLASIAIAVLIGISWPYSALWTLGLFISIDLIFNGWGHIIVALGARRRADIEEQAAHLAAGPMTGSEAKKAA